MREQCPITNVECKYYPDCFTDVHHTYWPDRHYRTGLEKSFRELSANKERLCRAEHDERHQELPPEKPDPRFMLNALRRVIVPEQ